MFPFPSIPSRGYACDAAEFDGTNDYLLRGGALTGVASSKMFTLAMWIDSTVTGAEQRLFVSADPAGGTNSVLNIRKNSTDKLEILGENAATTPILDLQTFSGIPAGWTCILCSLDMADTGKRNIYFGDADQTFATGIYTNDTLDFVSADWVVGARGDGGLKYTGGLANLMFWPGVYTDFDVQANRRLFITSAGKAANPAAAHAVLGPPAVCLGLQENETANNFALNDDIGATGGAFTVTGALTTYASSPSD